MSSLKTTICLLLAVAFFGGSRNVFAQSETLSFNRDIRPILFNKYSHSYQRYHDPEITTRIAQYELAYRMQASVPALVDLTSEPEHVLKLYGITESEGQTRGSDFSRNCLLARRLVEQGVRFVQVFARGWHHHKECFSIWMAGGGIKRGFTYGKTDEFGFAGVEDEVHVVHDFHATRLQPAWH